MSTLAEHPSEMTMAADDFQALEERVLRTVALLKGERELRISGEQHAARLAHRVEEQAAHIARLEEGQTAHIARLEEGQAAHIARLEEELSGLQKERESVRQRIERLLKHIDELGD
jgi:predicted nuclease with TOPRIM domain